MRAFIILILSLGALITLTACGKPSLEDAKLSDKQLNLEEYFDGRTFAYGQFNDRFGTVRRRFEVVIDGTWDGETLTLVEDFTYADGSTEERIWRLRKTGPIGADQTWEGTAEGVQGIDVGEERGDTFNWRYQIDLPVPDRDTLRVDFDDWMWLLEDGRLLNRAYMSRFGVDLGEVLIFFEKQ